MKKITSKQLRLNKINVSKLNALLGGNKNGGTQRTDDCPEETEADTCTTSRTTVDFENSNNTTC